MIQLLFLLVVGAVLYGISRATGGRLGVLQIVAVLLGLTLLVGGGGVALCGGYVAIVPDAQMSGLRLLGIVCLGVGALILYAGFWIVRATVRNARSKPTADLPPSSTTPPSPPAAPGS